MAQTQTPDKLHQPKAQTKKLRSRSSAAQQNGNGRGGIAKKETAKPTSNSSPNYMKPTTCSDARKEPMQVSAQSPAPATVVKAKNHADQSNSKPSPSSPPPLSVPKDLKTLARKASLRPRRPSMKKIYETSVMSPRRKVSRATCSSTLKESKFPNVSEVNPGNKVAELTSAAKACPFNYCSLHGRRHQHLQPLRRLPSARRRSFRTQRRSLKLKRVSSIRRGSFKKGGRSMNSDKTRSVQGSEIAPVIEETNYDFLNEIYTDEFDREISKFLESLEPSEDDTEFSEEGIEDRNGDLSEHGSHTSRGHSFVAGNGGEDDRTEGCNAEQSKLAAAEEWLENKEPEISSGYENSDTSLKLKLTEEEKVSDGGSVEHQGLSEDIYSEDDQTSEHDQTEHEDVSDGMIKMSPKLSNKQKARRRSVKWKKDIEMEVLRLMNPRAPRFLPVEADPADETVDLRHQQRDERKSSETWMMDNALQKAVRKLTPARSKKVALLVEAFETVMSLPIHDLTLKSPTSDLGRPVQACR